MVQGCDEGHVVGTAVMLADGPDTLDGRVGAVERVETDRGYLASAKRLRSAW